MRIRTQFLVTMLLFGVILAAISASALITNRQLEHADEQEKIAANIAQGASELSYLSNDYVIYRESQQLARWQSRFASFSNDVAGLDVDRPEQQALVGNIQANRQRLKEVFDSIVAAGGNTPPGQPVDPESLQVSWSRIAVQSQALASDATHLAHLERDQADQLRRNNLIVIFAMVGVFGAFFFVNYLTVQQRTLRSIARLQAGTAVVGSGDLDFKIKVRENDEIGDLSRAFNRMTSDLKTVTASKKDLEREFTERKKAEEVTLRQSATVRAINRVFHEALTCDTKEALDLACLTAAIELTQSEFGFVVETGADGLLHDTAMSNMGWESCAMHDKTGHRRAPGDFRIHGLYGRVVADGKSLLTNDPPSHKDSSGIPAGHPPIESFLGVPLIHGGKTMGMLGLANRAGGYISEDLEAMEALAPAIVEATARKKAEDKLAEQALMLANVNDAVIALAPDFRVTYWNRGAEAIYGYSADEMMGKLNNIVLKPVYIGATRAEVLARLNRDGHMEAESLRTRKDGRQVCIETHALMLRNKRGEPAGMVSVDRDITERKKAEERLAYLASFPEFDPLFVTEIDRAGNVVYANPSTRNVFPGVEAAGDKHPYHAGLPQAMLAANATINRELKIGGRYYEQTVTSLPQGQNMRTYGKDITDRKQAEEEVRQRTAELEVANKELEAFSYSVSHDLRAPLRSMEGFSSALLEDYAEKLDEQGKQYLAYIQDSSDLMGRLIDDLLRLSRITRSELSHESVDLDDLAKGVVSDLQKAEPRRKVKVTIASGLTAYGDRNLLRLAVQNLIGNAWKFSSKVASPRIEMGAIDHNGRKAYFVRDNGAGFDMAYADKLFKPFQRLHGTKEFSGTGIGLATVHRIVRRHGGEVWAEGQVGKGATFYFTLS
ncbi:MAG: PAS domain S-box protein [Dehalococcoidia bacterium]|nr:PAS domain S-box protein [Dehalococcoidia bacterium]